MQNRPAGDESSGRRAVDAQPRYGKPGPVDERLQKAILGLVADTNRASESRDARHRSVAENLGVDSSVEFLVGTSLFGRALDISANKDHPIMVDAALLALSRRAASTVLGPAIAEEIVAAAALHCTVEAVATFPEVLEYQTWREMVRLARNSERFIVCAASLLDLPFKKSELLASFRSLSQLQVVALLALKNGASVPDDERIEAEEIARRARVAVVSVHQARSKARVKLGPVFTTDLVENDE